MILTCCGDAATMYNFGAVWVQITVQAQSNYKPSICYLDLKVNERGRVGTV